MSKPVRWRVYDPEGLAEVVAGMVDRYGGQVPLAAAAKASRRPLPQATVSKLLNGLRGSLTQETLRGLLGVSDARERQRLHRALVSPDQRRRHVLYLRWLRRQLQQFGIVVPVSELQADEVGEFVAGVAAWPPQPTQDRFMLLRQLSYFRQKHTGVFSEFHHKIPAHLWATRDGVWRVTLAFLRVLAPVWRDGLDSGGVELLAPELHSRAFTRYIRAGLEAQMILLHRDTAIQRAGVDPRGRSQKR